MDSGPVILDISSDEEDWGYAKGGGSGRAGDRDDCNWITEVFQEIDRERDDSDDVILVGEVIVKPKAKEINGDDDDDCVILDGDPDKPISLENDSPIDDSDDLLIVGAKGQIACRDFPHPRHLCANYEFATTPHEKYCSQCHCYVCDALAPCVHWGNGVSNGDHCHATEKQVYWRQERRKIKQGDKAPPQAPPKLTDFYSARREHLSPTISSCSTTNRANPFARCSSKPIYSPGFPNTRLHHIIGMRTTFKRPGGAVLGNNRSGYEYTRLPPCLPKSQPFQSTAFSLPETSQRFAHTLTSQSQVSSPFVNVLPTKNQESHPIMDESMNLVSSEPQILLDPLFTSQPSQSQTSYEQKNGENALPFSQPESNLYVDSTFDVNGLKDPQFGSDISHQNHDFSSPLYDPCFPNGNGSNSLGFDTDDPWMFDQAFCSLSPVLDVVYPPEPPPATLDNQLFFNL